MRAKRVLIATSTLLIAILACSIPGGQANKQPDSAATIAAQAWALTLAAQRNVPVAPASTFPPPADAPPATATFTPSIPQVSVGVETNCRTGPGLAWDAVWALEVGQFAEVVAKNTPNNYWIIKIPDGGTCWLWGQYATKTGPDVPEMDAPAPPATATPEVPAALTNFQSSIRCTENFVTHRTDVDVSLSWTDAATNEDGYRIEINNNLPGNHTSGIKKLAANTTSYHDSRSVGAFALLPGSPVPSITYSVWAFNTAGESAKGSAKVSCWH